MAKRKVNKSQEIRDFVTKNPKASLKEVVGALGKRNIVVSIATVANVKSKSGLTRSRRGRPKGSSAGKRSNNCSSNDLALEALIDAKRLVAKAGSVQRAIEIIRAVEKLESIAG